MSQRGIYSNILKDFKRDIKCRFLRTSREMYIFKDTKNDNIYGLKREQSVESGTILNDFIIAHRILRRTRVVFFDCNKSKKIRMFE